MRRTHTLAGLVLSAAVFGTLAGYFVRVDMPDLTSLEDLDPPEMTRVLAADGSTIASFAVEKRILLDQSEVPESFRDALIASEDSRFRVHAGIDPVGVARAVWSDVRHVRLAEGASTLTMQLAGNLFLDRSQRTLRRKMQEAFLAMEIERRFSKQEILRMYCNQAHFGHGLYGVEAAARYYFGKPARELTVGESATLVGVLPRPASYSPFRDPERATERRNLVLGRMVAEGLLDPAAAERISREPIRLAPRAPSEGGGSGAYFVEALRRQLEQTYGGEELRRGGLTVRTTLDPRLQQIAEHAVAEGLRRFAERHGGEGAAPSGLQAALVAIDPATGEVLAHVGGADFDHSEFDRVTQARRQPGSLFKPFVYAAALGRGWTLADELIDEPTVFVDPTNPKPYQPENFERTYHGAITLRAALEQSVNIATVKLLDAVGYDPVIETARALGVQSRLRPYPSLALGAFELTLLEATSAYGAFANQGLHREAHWIRSVGSPDGRTLQQARPAVREAVSPQVAYLVSDALSGVIRRGTGRAASEVLPQTLAGKTGTTDDYTDAWFVGYSPHLVAGVWVGYDERRSLGDHETGARAALPIWIAFMEQALAGVADEPFAVPPGVVRVAVDLETGRRPAAGGFCKAFGVEAFLEGTEPTARCSVAEHVRHVLPYPFQRYPFDERGALVVPEPELLALAAREAGVAWDPRAGELEVFGPAGYFRVPVVAPPAAAAPPAEDGTADWRGTDGRPARAIRLGESRSSR